MLNANSPRAGSTRAVDCLLGGDSHGHNIDTLRTLVVARRFALQPHRAAIVAGLAWGGAAHG